MKVKIEFTVDINLPAWCENYGIDPNEVRNDVKQYVQYGAIEQLDSVGVLEPEQIVWPKLNT